MFWANLTNCLLILRIDLKIKQSLRFRLSLAPECLAEVKRRRETLSNARAAREAQMLHAPGQHALPLPGANVTYLVVVEMDKFHPNGQVISRDRRRFLVNEFLAGDGTISADLQALCVNPALPLTPLVGVAMALSDSKSSVIEATAPAGQIFSFLPLPIEERSASGLPVHVNGCFAISQNRRHLKWPSAGQTVDGTDPSLLWNLCLLRDVVPLSYVALVLAATRRPGVGARRVHGALPNLMAVDEKWRCVLEPFYARLFELPVFHSLLGGWRRCGGFMFYRRLVN